MKTILSKDVKKGAKVTFREGYTGIVMDARGAVSRVVKVEIFGMPGIFETGSEYIHKWDTVEQDGEIYKIELTPKQKNLEEQLRAMGW